jgi:putative transposase
VKIRDGSHVRNKAIYLVIGINLQGLKEVLGLWIEQTEGAKFWLRILTDLKNRGVQDIFIACVDGLKGFPQAIEAAFPKAQVQLCIVHLVRQSLQFAGYKERKAVAAGLQKIYRAATREEAERELDGFAEKWDARFPTISQMWRRTGGGSQSSSLTCRRFAKSFTRPIKGVESGLEPVRHPLC